MGHHRFHSVWRGVSCAFKDEELITTVTVAFHMILWDGCVDIVSEVVSKARLEKNVELHLHSGEQNCCYLFPTIFALGILVFPRGNNPIVDYCSENGC